MPVSVFVGTSVDGFIARVDGTFDFLGGDDTEPHGYEEFFASVDAVVIGRNTFGVVAAFPSWPYEQKRVVVLSSRPVDLAPARGGGGNVEQMSGEPADIVAKLAATGAHHLYIDGGITVQRFLSAGLVDRITVTRVPVLIGTGVPLFGVVLRDIPLRHVATQTYRGGLVKSEYEVVK
jgi:dihydrofolate reductase